LTSSTSTTVCTAGLETQYAAGLPKLYELLRRCAPGAKIIWATTTPVRQPDDLSKLEEERTRRVRERNRIAIEFMKRHGIPINDLFSLVIDHPEYHRNDGVHYNGKGNEVLGKQVASVIEKVLSDSPPGNDRYIEATLRDVRYGPHERNVLNFWKAASDRPTPVVVLIHGGGWTTGAKTERFDRQNIDVWSGIPYLEAGISVVSINYRLTPQHPLPAPVHDAARAVQFVRHKAAEWGLDKTRLAVAGGSAGGATSLWLVYHDDLADPDSDDPVARESTKPTCAAVEAPQTCIDPILCKEWVGEKILQHRMIPYSVGAKNAGELLKNYDKYKSTFREFSAYFHVDKDDPPVLLYGFGTTQYPAPNVGIAIHSPILCWKLKEKADQVGAECDFVLRSTRSKRFYNKTLVEFVKSKLLDN